METAPSDLFFAGRSVLHRIDDDIRARTSEGAEASLARRLQQGSRVRVLFLDPRSDLIHRLANEERQTHGQLLTDLARSIGICKRLNDKLWGTVLPATTHLQVCVFDEVPYFAFHRSGDLFFVGFYFANALGHKSGVYEAIDQITRTFFEEHFGAILLRAESNWIIRVDQHTSKCMLNQELVDVLLTSIRKIIGTAETDRAVAGSTR